MTIRQIILKAKKELPPMKNADFLKKLRLTQSTYNRIMKGNRGTGIRVIELNIKLEKRINDLLSKNN